MATQLHPRLIKLVVLYLLPSVQFGDWCQQSQEKLVLLTRHVGFYKSKQTNDLHKQKKCPSRLHLQAEKQGASLARIFVSG